MLLNYNMKFLLNSIFLLPFLHSIFFIKVLNCTILILKMAKKFNLPMYLLILNTFFCRTLLLQSTIKSDQKKIKIPLLLSQIILISPMLIKISFSLQLICHQYIMSKWNLSYKYLKMKTKKNYQEDSIISMQHFHQLTKLRVKLQNF